MQINASSFTAANGNMSFGDWQSRVAREQFEVVHGGSVALASETSLANQDLQQAWSHFGQDVLPYFGRFPRI